MNWIPLFTRIYLLITRLFYSWWLLLACSSEIKNFFYTWKLVLNKKKAKTSDLLPKCHNDRWLDKIVNPLNQGWTNVFQFLKHENKDFLKSKCSLLHHLLTNYINIKCIISWLLVTLTKVFQFGNRLKRLNSRLYPSKNVL